MRLTPGTPFHLAKYSEKEEEKWAATCWKHVCGGDAAVVVVVVVTVPLGALAVVVVVVVMVRTFVDVVVVMSSSAVSISSGVSVYMGKTGMDAAVYASVVWPPVIAIGGAKEK